MKKLSFLILALLCVWSLTAQDKPLIGISSDYDGSVSVPKTYVLSVLRAGGIPLVFPANNKPEVIAQMVASVDAVILTGGQDVDPLKYYGEEPVVALGSVLPFRDEFDMMLVKEAVKQGKPVLGICRGEQVMNVAFGGSLYQDLPSQKAGVFQHRQSKGSADGNHSIILEKDSKLCELLGKEEVVVNSFHHQAVKAIAPGFRVVARARDGVVEAIEMIGNPKVFGTQFHPEGPTSAGKDEFLPIFEYLVECAKENAAEK